MLEIYRQLPATLDPVAFSLGALEVRWYSLMYLVGILTVWGMLQWRWRKGEFTEGGYLPKDWITTLLSVCFLGLLAGARIGYVLLYDPRYFWQDPWAAFSPLDPATGQFVGIYGLSYFGGLAGAIVAFWLCVRRWRVGFWQLADFLIVAVPAGYFWGRIGNFLNGELYGIPTDRLWGMYFPADGFGLLRHPNQIYEALGEGLLLFLVLWLARRQLKTPGSLVALYLSGYGLIRYFLEFWRDPLFTTPIQGLTRNLSQTLALALAVIGSLTLLKLLWSRRSLRP